MPDDGKTTVRVGVGELSEQLGHYLHAAQHGTLVLVTSADGVIAEIRAPGGQARPARVLGLLRGKLTIPDDFNQWPDGFLDEMEAW